MDRYRRLLRRRDFRLLWVGATASALGDGMSFVALVWLVLERGGDPVTVGGLAAVYTAPVVVGGLVAGLVLDRVDRRRAIALDNLLRGLAIGSVPLAEALGVLTIGQLFVVAGLYGLLFMVSLAGIPSLIPGLVEPDELTTANAMETLSYGIGGLAGPAVAGAVIALVGAPAVLAIDAATYAIFVACLLAMRIPRRSTAVPPDDPGGGDTPPAAGLRPAVRFVLASPPIVAITLMFMAFNIGEGMLAILLPVYARDVLAGGAPAYGVLASAFTAGILGGSLLVGAVGWRWPLGRSIAVAQVAAGLVLVVLLARPALPVAAATLALSGLLASSLTAWAQTIRMRLIPDAMAGRVFALLRTLMQATPPLGSLSAGLLLAGGEVSIVIGAVVALVVVPGLAGVVAPALGPAATREPARRAVSRRGRERSA